MVAQDALYEKEKCPKRCVVCRCLMNPQCLLDKHKGGDCADLDILNNGHRVLSGLRFAGTCGPRSRIDNIRAKSSPMGDW
jgi:hypothetical protein